MRKVPGVNASWGGDKIYQYKDIDVSVAVAIDGGLITPIIRKADQKGLSTISNEMKDLAKRAKDGKLKPEEFQGGGFSICNLGMFGIKDFLAVINPPQACILAVGAGEKRPVVKGDEIKIATVMSVTLSTDHRVVDGALGAEFLQEFKTPGRGPAGAAALDVLHDVVRLEGEMSELTQITAREANQRFSELLAKVESEGRGFVVTKRGRPGRAHSAARVGKQRV